MKRLTVLILALLLVAPAIAKEDIDQDTATDLETLATRIRSGEETVYGDLSMDYRKGRFHTIHVDLLGLGCGTCHFGDKYQDDYQLLRKDEQLRRRAKGQATHEACLACHQKGGIATTFYMRRTGEKLDKAVKR
ncbi:MAG: hypothetical protein WCA32_04330 [Chromatiaceae bacterium]|jgi:hypothetical protein